MVSRTTRNSSTAGELFVGDFRPVHPESMHFDLMHRLRIRHVVRAHIETAAWDPDHPLRCVSGTGLRCRSHWRIGPVRIPVRRVQ
jgi:hypothetical protein